MGSSVNMDEGNGGWSRESKFSNSILKVAEDWKENPNSRTKPRFSLFWFAILGASLLGFYCISFFHFVRSHEATIAHSCSGVSFTERVIVIPDTRMNRLRVALYAPLIKRLVKAGAIEWRDP